MWHDVGWITGDKEGKMFALRRDGVHRKVPPVFYRCGDTLDWELKYDGITLPAQGRDFQTALNNACAKLDTMRKLCACEPDEEG